METSSARMVGNDTGLAVSVTLNARILLRSEPTLGRAPLRALDALNASPHAFHNGSARILRRPASATAPVPPPDRRGREKGSTARENVSYPNDSPGQIPTDLMLPAEDGLSILRRLRGAGDKTPIIMLTARSEDIDRIIGLELGADDYLGKPFNPRELLARIAAVLRRRAAISACKRRTDGTSGAARFRSSTQSDGPRESRRRHRQNPLAFRALRWRNAVWPTCPRGYGSKSPLTLYSSTFVLNHGEHPCLI